MASPKKDPRTGEFRYRPVFRGKQIFCHLGTTKEREATALAYAIDRAIQDLESGQRTVPQGVDTLEWIRSGGTLQAPHLQPHTLGELIQSYQESVPRGSKAESTLSTERTHFKNILNHFGERLLLSDLSPQKVEGYVRARRDRDPVTLKKELSSLGLVWRYGERIKWVVGKSPTIGVRLPKKREKEMFRTFSQITELLEETPEEERKALWECCVLAGNEMVEFLNHIKTIKEPAHLSPMICTAAFTGARRSELMRSRRRDWDLKNKTLTIREKKRVHSASESFRYVYLNDQLVKIMKPYLKKLKGDLVFCEEPDQELSPIDAERIWYHAVKKTKWENLRGWHTLRHSYGTTLGVKKIPDLTVRKLMGHTTRQMQERYRHLIPEDRESIIHALDSYSG